MARSTAEEGSGRRRLIEAADSARREVARDLHDGAQQQLVVCLAQLQRAQHKWATDPERAKELLDDGLAGAQSALLALRELAAGMHPPILIHKGLGAAIEDLAARQGIPVALDLGDERLPAPCEASLYFFVSEALTNVAKHAHASSARIRIGVDGDRLIVVVSDDGVGGAGATSQGTGLPGLDDRVAALDGTLTIASDAGLGTTLSAEMPVPVAGSS